MINSIIEKINNVFIKKERIWSDYLKHSEGKLYTYSEALYLENDEWRLPIQDDFNFLVPPIATEKGLFIRTYNTLNNTIKEENTFFPYNDEFDEGSIANRGLVKFWLGSISSFSHKEEHFFVGDRNSSRFLYNDTSINNVFKPFLLRMPVILIRRTYPKDITIKRINNLVFSPFVLGYSLRETRCLTFRYTEALIYEKKGWRIPTISDINLLLSESTLEEGFGYFGEKCYILKHKDKSHFILPKNKEVQTSLGGYYQDCCLWVRKDDSSSTLVVLSIFTTAGISSNPEVRYKIVEKEFLLPTLFGYVPKAGIWLVKSENYR